MSESRVGPWLGWLLANSLTLARLVVAVAFPWIATSWRAPLALAACLSDLVDGQISRILHGESKLGRLLDPVADKTLVLAIVGTLWWEGQVSLWQITLIALREWAILLIVCWLLVAGRWRQIGDMAPRWPGKVATAAQFVFLFSLLVFQRVIPAIFTVTVALSALAAADYLRAFWHAWLARDQG